MRLELVEVLLPAGLALDVRVVQVVVRIDARRRLHVVRQQVRLLRRLLVVGADADPGVVGLLGQQSGGRVVRRVVPGVVAVREVGAGVGRDCALEDVRDLAGVLPHVADDTREPLVVEVVRLDELRLELVQVGRDVAPEQRQRVVGTARMEVAEVGVVGLVLARDVDDVLDRPRRPLEDRVAARICGRLLGESRPCAPGERLERPRAARQPDRLERARRAVSAVRYDHRRVGGQVRRRRQRRARQAARSDGVELAPIRRDSQRVRVPAGSRR